MIRVFVCVVSLWESGKWNNHNSNDTHTHTRREKKKELAPFLNTTRLVFFSLTASTVRALGVSCWPDLSFVLVCACAVSCTSVFFRGSVSLCLRDWRRWRPRFKVALQSALRKTVQVKVVLALQIFYKYAFIESSNKNTHTHTHKTTTTTTAKKLGFSAPLWIGGSLFFPFCFFFFSFGVGFSSLLPFLFFFFCRCSALSAVSKVNRHLYIYIYI